MRMFSSTKKSVEIGAIELEIPTNHDDEGVYVVENESERRLPQVSE
jgi:hypothetical protein